jgi:SAM-dependent methyltransferase
MRSGTKLSKVVQSMLRCPVCGGTIRDADGQLVCEDIACGTVYPIVDGVPVLLNERSSLFSTQALVRQSKVRKVLLRRGKTAGSPQPQSLLEKLEASTPSISRNIRSVGNVERFAGLLTEPATHSVVLVVGGRTLGKGISLLLSHPSIELVESDVAFGPRTALICDAHDIPFEDGCFDGVIVQGVLEHVVDPARCVTEMHRVLKVDGLVYAETAFMQQVHGGRYDFARFTHLGQRLLFRAFEEIESGALCGPGMALAWAYRYLLLSFTESRTGRALLSAFANLTAFWLKHLDDYLVRKPGALDAASAYYFMGRKRDLAVPDQDLVELYRGAQLGCQHVP